MNFVHISVYADAHTAVSTAVVTATATAAAATTMLLLWSCVVLLLVYSFFVIAIYVVYYAPYCLLLTVRYWNRMQEQIVPRSYRKRYCHREQTNKRMNETAIE